MTLSSKVNFPHTINFRVLCGANVVTHPAECKEDETRVVRQVVSGAEPGRDQSRPGTNPDWISLLPPTPRKLVFKDEADCMTDDAQVLSRNSKPKPNPETRTGSPNSELETQNPQPSPVPATVD